MAVTETVTLTHATMVFGDTEEAIITFMQDHPDEIAEMNTFVLDSLANGTVAQTEELVEGNNGVTITRQWTDESWAEWNGLNALTVTNGWSREYGTS